MQGGECQPGADGVEEEQTSVGHDNTTMTASPGKMPPRGPAGGRGWVRAGAGQRPGRPSMRHANSDFKIIVTERRKERKRWD